MGFKGASSDLEPIKNLSADQGAAIQANTNTKIVFASLGSDTSNTLNIMDMGSEIERVSLLAKMADVELSPAQQEIGVAIIKALPAGATIRDFLEACRLDNAKRLGVSPEMLDTIAPLLAALEVFGKPGEYGALFNKDLGDINLNPFASQGDMVIEAVIGALTQRNRFIDSQVARNRNGLTRGRKRHKKHRRALAIQKLLQMDNPPIFIDPMGDSDLLKKIFRAGQAQGRKDDFCQLVFEPAGYGMSFFKDFKTVDGKTIDGKKITIIDVGPTHLGTADLLARNGMAK